MLDDPHRHWPFPWNPRRLVVQHMDALDLQYDDGSFDGDFSSSSMPDCLLFDTEDLAPRLIGRHRDIERRDEAPRPIAVR